MMEDQYGRTIEYMRISVTDRCNLRCRYCMPEGISLTSMDEILTYEEICRVVKAAVALGIVHFRLTGGEPLARRQVGTLVRMMKEIPGVGTVKMTTNGVALKDCAGTLKAAGLDGLNVSLDTVDRREFFDITGRDSLDSVLSGIDAAIDSGIPVKLNAVVDAGREYDDLIRYAQRKGLLLRFIELMPIGYGKNHAGEGTEELFSLLESRYGAAVLLEKAESFGSGPAEYYQFPELSRPIGFIRAVHHAFCADCNRVRLSAEGKLKLCLCYEDGIDLRELLRNGSGEEALKTAMREAILRKPAGHCFKEPDRITEIRPMMKIGG